MDTYYYIIEGGSLSNWRFPSCSILRELGVEARNEFEEAGSRMAETNGSLPYEKVLYSTEYGVSRVIVPQFCRKFGISSSRLAIPPRTGLCF